MAFFKRGVTMACFKQDGADPDKSELFMMFVMMGTSESRCSSTNDVGKGSKQQDFGGEDLITFLTKSSVAG